MNAKNSSNLIHIGEGYGSDKLGKKSVESFREITNCSVKRMQDGSVSKNLEQLALERKRMLEVLRSINRK
ncbi:MAG: hypothetical protein RBG13Loki_0933 [Promethearchaeota archaeon CR_4]|nr:MAG: hypothetical protein RBG13Loki_0933 [Candidatus Lokiarchaeota archaeon CR_4]